MRRMVKEDLLTFEGKPLFPERRAYTVGYALSGPEQELYDRVTEYVRTEMGRADRIGEQGQSRRSNSVGFALTVLQRRLASSPEAITRSLERRAERLGQRLRDIGQRRAEFQGSRVFGRPFDHAVVAEDQADATLEDLDDFDDAEGDMSEAERARFEERMEQVVDSATAALWPWRRRSGAGARTASGTSCARYWPTRSSWIPAERPGRSSCSRSTGTPWSICGAGSRRIWGGPGRSS